MEILYKNKIGNQFPLMEHVYVTGIVLGGLHHYLL